jgi:hypothetical protein
MMQMTNAAVKTRAERMPGTPVLVALQTFLNILLPVTERETRLPEFARTDGRYMSSARAGAL